MVHPRIERNPDIMFGKPVIKGTRITVEVILRKLSGGKTFAEILAAHPHLTIEDLYAAAAFAADDLAQEEIVVQPEFKGLTIQSSGKVGSVDRIVQFDLPGRWLSSP